LKRGKRSANAIFKKRGKKLKKRITARSATAASGTNPEKKKSEKLKSRWSEERKERRGV